MTEYQEIMPCKVRFLRREKAILGTAFLYEVVERGSCLNQPILQSEVIERAELKETLRFIKRWYKSETGCFPEIELVEEVE